MPRRTFQLVRPVGVSASSSSRRPQPQTLGPITKRALLIGCEYVHLAATGELERLPGCFQDADNMKHVLINRFHFPAAGIRILHDASKSQILAALNQLKQQAIDDTNVTTLFVYYSGHGSYVPNQNAEQDPEPTGQDQTIVPADFVSQGMIRDDELHRHLIQNLPARVTLRAMFDSCFSGSVLDLQFRFDTNQMSWQGAAIPQDSGFDASLNCMSLSGCTDSQTSASTYNFHRTRGWSGAMTSTFIEVVKRIQGPVLVGSLLTAMRASLQRDRFEQVPQICALSNSVSQVFLP